MKAKGIAAQFTAAMGELKQAQGDFATACAELDNVRAAANPHALARIDARIAACNGAMKYAESGASTIGTIAASLSATGKAGVPLNVQRFALSTVQGAALAVKAVTYETRQFVARVQNPNAPGMAPGLIAAGMLAGLGALGGIF